ncbi:MAG TPA: hypothetical protein PLJ35_14740 [Anaerolineae bacterium]|nr:hypothetical protein [Anaerolineae bacterium]
MKQRILDLVRERRYVSFVELERLLGEGMAGDGCATLGDNENVVLWSGVNDAFAGAVSDLLQSGAVKLVPTSWMTYAADGAMLSLPLVKGRYRYRRPHWLPAVLDVGAGGQGGANLQDAT